MLDGPYRAKRSVPQWFNVLMTVLVFGACVAGVGVGIAVFFGKGGCGGY